MARSTQRAGPSQTQRQTQTQRTQRRRAETDEEDESDDGQHAAQDALVEEGLDRDPNNIPVKLANDLVRYALFSEHKRAPLKRDEINKKILGTNTRSFNMVFAIAQAKLRNAFGMELVELPSRAGLDQVGEEATQEPTQTQGLKRKEKAAGSKTYMLRSCLDPILIEYMAQTDDEVLDNEAGDQGLLFPRSVDDNISDNDDDDPPTHYGSILSWTRADQLGPAAILYTILALILVNGKVISDTDLRRHLKSLHLSSNPSTKPVIYGSTSTIQSMTLDEYLGLLLRQNYLDREQVGGADLGRKGKKGGAGTKRLRTQQEDADEGRVYEWRWGPRAHCEAGEEAVAKFIAEFMVNTVEEDEGGNAQASRKKQEEMRKKMYAGVEKAAGGKLAEIKAAVNL